MHQICWLCSIHSDFLYVSISLGLAYALLSSASLLLFLETVSVEIYVNFLVQCISMMNLWKLFLYFRNVYAVFRYLPICKVIPIYYWISLLRPKNYSLYHLRHINWWLLPRFYLTVTLIYFSGPSRSGLILDLYLWNLWFISLYLITRLQDAYYYCNQFHSDFRWASTQLNYLYYWAFQVVSWDLDIF